MVGSTRWLLHDPVDQTLGEMSVGTKNVQLMSAMKFISRRCPFVN
jgi:hypothetical protein